MSKTVFFLKSGIYTLALTSMLFVINHSIYYPFNCYLWWCDLMSNNTQTGRVKIVKVHSTHATYSPSRYADIPKEWEPPAPQPFKVQSDLQWYLMDPDAYDQFLIGIGTGVALQVWQNALPEPVMLQERPVRTCFYSFATISYIFSLFHTSLSLSDCWQEKR